MENTKIQWATHTFNPWIGCTKVSPGCANCYAAVQTFPRVQRARGRELWGKGRKRQLTSKSYWNQAIKWNMSSPHWERARVFPSLCDPFDEEVPNDWRLAFFDLIKDTPNLDWLLLTKRPEAALRFYEKHIWTHSNGLLQVPAEKRHDYTIKFLPNVWLGVSAEDQKHYDLRVQTLMGVPAKVRFVSAEPLLGPIDLKGFWGMAPDWIITGGESGPGSRECNVEWIGDIVRKCRSAGIACFVKQLGANCVTGNANAMDWPDTTELTGHGDGFAAARATFKHKKGGDMNEWPNQLRVRQFPMQVFKHRE